MNPPASDAPNDYGIDFLYLTIVLAKHKVLLIATPMAAAVIAALVSLILTPTYTAVARILPPQQNQSMAAALLGQVGAMSALSTNALNIRNPSDLYVGMLKSRSVADGLIDQFNLREQFKSQTWDDARRSLANITNISAGRDGMISIEVEGDDAVRAAAIANAYIDQLGKLNERLAVTEAARRRLFFENQLRNQKDALAGAEGELRRTQEQTGLIKLDEQGKAIIEAVAHLRAQIAAKEVQLSAMQSFATERNPERIHAEAELAGLRKQLQKMEQKSVGLEAGGMVPMRNVPEVGLEYVRRLRDVKYQETLFELLAKQYELARLDEAKDASIIQTVDRAVPPERRTHPKRTQIVLLVMLAALFIAICIAFLAELYERIKADKASASRLDVLRRYLTTWRHGAKR